jgi:low affinity Fe/Cu permease
MTDTATRPGHIAPESPQAASAPTARSAVRANARAAERAAERAEEIRKAPQLHVPKLVVSRHVRGDSPLDKIAGAVNKVCGSMWVFLFITTGIVAWLFLGNIVGFDKTPWPLLLTILNLPQLSIMVSLQVSANRAQAASDRRAIADHETLIALHEMAKQQLTILHGQDKVLAMLDNFASKDMPGRQQEILDTARRILAQIGDAPAAG